MAKGKKKKALPVAKTYTEQEVADALRATGGYLTHTADYLQVPVKLVKTMINKSKFLTETLMDTKLSCLDVAESELMKKVKEGNLLAIMFYLKCQGDWNDRPETKRAGSTSDKPLYIKLVPIGFDGTIQEVKNPVGRPKKINSEIKILPKKTLTGSDFVDVEALDV